MKGKITGIETHCITGEKKEVEAEEMKKAMEAIGMLPAEAACHGCEPTAAKLEGCKGKECKFQISHKPVGQG